MSSPRNYASILGKLFQNPKIRRADLVSLLYKSNQFNDIIIFLVDSQKLPNNTANNELYFNILIDMLAEKEDFAKPFGLQEINKILRLIADNPFQNSDIKFNEKLTKILRQIFAKYNANEADKTFQLLTEPMGTFSNFCLAIYSSVNPSISEKAFPKILNSIDIQYVSSINAATTFFSEHKLKDLTGTAKESYDTYGGDDKISDLIKPMLISDVPIQRLAFKLIRSLFNFLEHANSVKIFTSISSSITDILHKTTDSMRIEIASIFADLPADPALEDYPLEAQLRMFLKDLSQHIYSGENLYCSQVLKFVTDRKSVPALKDIISDLYQSADTLLGAMIISTEFGLLDSDQTFKDNCFPKEVKTSQIAFAIVGNISYIIAHKKLKTEIFEPLAKSIFSILSNHTLLSDENLRPSIFCAVSQFVHLFKQYPGMVAENMLVGIPNITDIEVLTCISGEFEKILADSKNVQVPSPDKTLFVNYFIHLVKIFIRRPTGLSEFSALLRVYKPNITEIPKNWVHLYDIFVVDPYLAEIRSSLLSKSKQTVELVIAAAYLSNLSKNDISDLVNLVISTQYLNEKKEKSIDKQLFIDFFKALSERNFAAAIEELNILAMQKKKKKFLFIGKEAKQIEYSVRSATILTLSVILKPKPTLSAQQQDTIYNILNKQLPVEKKMPLFAEEIEKLIDVFPLLNNSIRPIELIDRAVSIPLFSPSLVYKVASKSRLKDIEFSFEKTVFHFENY